MLSRGAVYFLHLVGYFYSINTHNMTQTEIKAGMVVAYTEPGTNRQGWYRVTRATKNKVNLGSVFGRGIYHKGVPKEEVREDEAAWYSNWSKSETYQCM